MSRVLQGLIEKPVETAFIELEPPGVTEALVSLAESGRKRVVLLPLLLTAAKHVLEDIPEFVSAATRRYPDLEVTITPHIGVRKFFFDLLEQRVREAEEKSKNKKTRRSSRKNTVLVFLGAGSRHKKANAQVRRVAKEFSERAGFVRVEVGFIDVAFPRTREALRTAASFSPQRVIAVPFLLFPGALAGKVRAEVEEMRKEEPEIEFLCAEPFGRPSFLAETLARYL